MANSKLKPSILGFIPVEMTIEEIKELPICKNCSSKNNFGVQIIEPKTEDDYKIPKLKCNICGNIQDFDNIGYTMKK